MSKSKKKKKTNKKHTPRRTYQNVKYNQNIYDKSLEFTPYDVKKGFDFWELLRKIGVWIILIATVVGMSSWIFAMFR